MRRVGLSRWLLAAFGFLISSAYWPGISGASTAPRWIIAAIALSTALFFIRRIKFTIAHLAGTAYLIWAALSLLWTSAPLDSIGAWFVIPLACAFCLGSTTQDLRPLWVGAALGVTVSSLLAIGQWYGWRPFPEIESPSGTFVNRNFLAEFAVLVAAACVTERLWWALPGLLPAIILTQARGAWVALFVVSLVSLRQWSRPLAHGIALWCFMLACGVGASWLGDGWKLTGITTRLWLWLDTVQGLTWMGHGIGSFYVTFPAFATHFNTLASRPEHAHNEILEIAFELGPVGVLLALAFCATLWGRVTAARLVLIAAAVESLGEFPLHSPAAGVLVLFAAGHCARDLGSIRDQAWYGRILARLRLAAFRKPASVHARADAGG